MIRVRSDWRGRPSGRQKICTVDTPREAIRVVRALRKYGMTPTWRPAKPYTVRVDAEHAHDAVEQLTRLVGLWFAIENGDVYTEADHQRFAEEYGLA